MVQFVLIVQYFFEVNVSERHFMCEVLHKMQDVSVMVKHIHSIVKQWKNSIV